MKEKILKVAKSFGFDNYMFVGNWNSYNIYTPYNNDGTIPCIGQPVFVLVKGEEIRVAEESEWELFITELDEDRGRTIFSKVPTCIDK